jgi:SNF2 family DNA or RNA helicase
MVKNKKTAQNELHKIEDLQQRLNQFTPEVVDRKMKEKWSWIRTEISQKNLKEFPIELLDLVSKENLPLEQLIQEGIEDVYSASINGRHSDRVLNIAKEFSNAHTAHIFPSLGQSNAEHLDLIKLLINSDEQKQETETFKKEAVSTISSYREQLNKIIEHDTNALFRLFQNKEKRNEVDQAKEYIQKHQFEIDTIARNLEGSSTLSMPNSLAFKTFEENKEAYYRQIKELTNYQPADLISNLPYYLRDKLSEFEAIFSELPSNAMDDRIREQWSKVKEPLVQEELENMSLSLLNLENSTPYSIVTLNANGYKNVQDLAKQDEKQLLNSGMFPNDQLKRLYQDVQEIEASISEKLFPRFNPDMLRPDEVELLKLIYTRIQLNKKIKEKHEGFENLSIELKDSLDIVEEFDTDPYNRLFQDREVIERVQDEKLIIFEDLRALYSIVNDTKHLTDVTVSNREMKNDFSKNSASYYAVIESITGTSESYTPSGLPDFIVSKVNEFALDTTGLNGTLRPYQEFGTKYALFNKRTLLGDEMGLGKTMQAIAMISHLHQNGHSHSLVVVPLSVMANWKREIKKWSTLKVFVYHRSDGERQRDEALADWKKVGGVMLTTYGHAQRFERKDMRKLDCLVVDEAHYVKNPHAKRSKRIYKISEIAEYVLYMTGTPLENHVGEMQQLVSVLNSELGEQFNDQMDLENPENFKRFVSMVYLRRKRDDVLQELPEIETVEMWSDFSPVEQKYYDDAVRQGLGGLMKMRRAGFYGQTPKKSEKLEQLLDICEEAHENGHKVLIFSFFKSVLKVVQQHLGDRTFEVISGDVSNNRRQEIIDEFTDSKAGSVLISQIEAGGVGLNIQAANIVILCEPQWKPSTENQAISRVYRMGQTRNVIVYRLLTENAIDETMMGILGHKTNIFNAYARDSDVADAYERRTPADEVPESQAKNKVFEVEKKRLEEKEGVLIEV